MDAVIEKYSRHLNTKLMKYEYEYSQEIKDLCNFIVDELSSLQYQYIADIILESYPDLCNHTRKELLIRGAREMVKSGSCAMVIDFQKSLIDKIELPKESPVDIAALRRKIIETMDLKIKESVPVSVPVPVPVPVPVSVHVPMDFSDWVKL